VVDAVTPGVVSVPYLCGEYSVHPVFANWSTNQTGHENASETGKLAEESILKFLQFVRRHFSIPLCIAMAIIKNYLW